MPKLRIRQHTDKTGSDTVPVISPLGLLKSNISYVNPTSDKFATESLKDMVCLRVNIGKKTQVFSACALRKSSFGLPLCRPLL